MKIINEVKDGVLIKRITDDEYSYSFGYYSANKWVDNNRIVLIRGKGSDLINFNKTCELVLVDIENQTVELLVSFNGMPPKEIGAGYGEGYVVHGEDIYFVDRASKSNSEEILYHFNLQTRKPRVLYKGANVYFPHITQDGRYVNVELLANEQNENYACVVIDTVEKKAEKVFEKKFEKSLNQVAHVMICPTDKEKIFFCHEGNTFYVSNRLWMYDKKTGMRCIAKQRLDSNGNLGDCFGHECWAPDGNGLYFVKYPCSPTPPTGICYVDVNGNQTDVIYGKYDYWHVCCAPNNKYLAADVIGGKRSGVCFINMETGEEKLLFEAATTWSHPSHPHPSFDLECEKLIFHELYENKVSIGIVNVKEII